MIPLTLRFAQGQALIDARGQDRGFVPMKKHLIKYFICPMCRRDGFDIQIVEQADSEVIQGQLACSSCNRIYPIVDGIPYLVSDDIRGCYNLTATLHQSERSDSVESAQSQMETEVKVANIRFHDKIAQTYEKDAHTLRIFQEGKGSQERIKEIVKLLRSKTSGNLFLDVGCGSGNVLKFASECFEQTIGLDISVEMLKISRGRSLDVAIADAYKMPIKNEIVDAISGFSFLHHLYNPATFFQEAYRVLKNGGWLYTDWDPNARAKQLFQGRLFNLVRKAIYKYYYKQRSLDEETDNYFKISEYHQTYGGLNPYNIKAQLHEIGFTDVDIIFHYNSSSIYQKLSLSQKFVLLSAKLLNFKIRPINLELIAPYFLILARKA